MSLPPLNLPAVLRAISTEISEKFNESCDLRPQSDLAWGDLSSDVLMRLAHVVRKPVAAFAGDFLREIKSRTGFTASLEHDYLNFIIPLTSEFPQITEGEPENRITVIEASSGVSTAHGRQRLRLVAETQVLLARALGLEVRLLEALSLRALEVLLSVEQSATIWFARGFLTDPWIREICQSAPDRFHFLLPSRDWFVGLEASGIDQKFAEQAPAQLARLLLATSPEHGRLIDFSICEFAESQNMPWAVAAVTQQLERLGGEGSGASAIALLKEDTAAYRAARRLRQLPLFFDRAVRRGEMLELYVALQSTLTATVGLIHQPTFRQLHSRNALPAEYQAVVSLASKQFRHVKGIFDLAVNML